MSPLFKLHQLIDKDNGFFIVNNRLYFQVQFILFIKVHINEHRVWHEIHCKK